MAVRDFLPRRDHPTRQAARGPRICGSSRATVGRQWRFARAWLAERLSKDLGRSEPHGTISSALHRDDFSRRGMAVSRDATQLPFEIEGRHILLIDDVLYTGRTIRAALDSLRDLGRPQVAKGCAYLDRLRSLGRAGASS